MWWPTQSEGKMPELPHMVKEGRKRQRGVVMLESSHLPSYVRLEDAPEKMFQGGLWGSPRPSGMHW